MEQQGRRCGTEQEARGRLSAWRLFRLYWFELIKLNVLFLLLCLPVVTIPAAIAAMNRIVLDMLYRKPFDYRMWRGMMTTFRRDFWRSTAAGIVLGAALAVCGYGAYSVGWRGEQTNVIAAAACLVMAFTSFNLGMHVFMQLAYLELSLAQAFKNAAILLICELKRNLACDAVLILFVLAMVASFPFLAPLLLICFFSYLCFVLCCIQRPALDRCRQTDDN